MGLCLLEAKVHVEQYRALAEYKTHGTLTHECI